MSKYHAIVEVPGLPKTVNELGRKHWAIKVKHNRKWEALVIYCLRAVATLPKEPLKKVRLEFTRYSSVEPDFDNLVNSFKCVVDALVKHRVIEDDKRAVVGYPTYAWEKCKKNEGKIEIEIREI